MAEEHIIKPEDETQPAGKPDFSVRIGNTTYLVGVHFNEKTKETLEEKIRKMIRKSIMDGNI